MSTTAWSALADRFAALANEQEFRFTTSPFNTATAFEDDRDRFRLAYPFGGSPDAPTSVGIVIGQGLFRRGEFVRINRFRWLSWAAGLLLNTDPCSPPEIHWWQHPCETHQNRIDTDEPTNRATLHDLARLSAETARQLAGSNRLTPASPIGAKTDNWPAIQENLQIFRERFNAERWHTARPDAALVAFPDYNVFDSWKRRVIDPTAPDRHNPRPWTMHGTVWGDTEPVDAFVNLATDAGTALPLELTFVPPMFPWFNTLSNMRPAPVTSWLEFLFLTCPTCFTLELDAPVPSSRVARLTTSAFTTSVNAIDRVKRLDSAAFLREFRERAIRSNPWLDGADEAAALAAVEAAAQPTKKTCEPNVAKPLHWTEYPERVETFGDLLSILETLDRHEMESGFTAPDFQKERGRVTAYKVDFHNRQHRFNPQLDQMLGLERLLDRFDIDGHSTLTRSQARELRQRAAKALNRDGAAVNAMTFTEIADVLDASECAHSVPAAPTPTTGTGIKTFGEFLANVRSIEEAAASLRATADAMNGEPGSGYWRIQAGVYEADAEYRKHASLPFLEAHVNRLYGPFTHANLLRVRGEFCAARHCGSTQADQLPVEEVVAALGCPGAPPVGSRTAVNDVGVVSPPKENVVKETPDVFRMSDIRDLLRYRREWAAYEQWCNTTSRTSYSVSEFHTRACAMALNAPNPARLTEDQAVELAVYRCLVRAAHEQFGRELDEQSLLIFVGDVAGQHGRTVAEMWSLAHDEFGRLMAGTVETTGSVATGVPQQTRKEPVAPPAPTTPTVTSTPTCTPVNCADPERKEGGRPKLGEGSNASPQEKALRNVYEVIRRACQTGWGPKALVAHFRSNKDFKERLKTAEKDFGEPLFRSALAWIKENPDQETQSGNVS